MKHGLLILLIFICLPLTSSGQKYNRSAGLRGGLTSGFTYKKFLNQEKAMEAILSFREAGVQLTALREYHEITLLEYSDNFFFMQGYGGHIGFLYTDRYDFLFTKTQYPSKKVTPVIGMDAYLGLEYRIEEFPLVGGIDFKPFIEFSLRDPFSIRMIDFAFFIKYTF